MVSGPRVGIDFGTSHTVAVCQWRDGPVYPLLFDASPLLPSAVFAADGRLLVGRDAERSARADPAAFEPSPKLRVDDGTILLGSSEYAVVDVIAAVLRRCLDEATRVAGPPEQVVLTHPASWGTRRKAVLVEAATRAGVAGVVLVPEPAAAALYFSQLVDRRHDQDAVVVYDFGGGTFDVAVVRRRGPSWEVVASAGLEDVGGVDLDGALIDVLRTGLSGRDPSGWLRLIEPRTASDRRQRQLLWEDARAAKEQLSRNSTADVHIPIYDTDIHVTREEFERRARPMLDRTVALTAETLSRSGLTTQVAGVFLVGGSSRIPLVATLLHQQLGVAPIVTEQPELVVAQGALQAPVEVWSEPDPTQFPGVPVSGLPATPASGMPATPASGIPAMPVSGMPVAPVSGSYGQPAGPVYAEPTVVPPTPDAAPAPQPAEPAPQPAAPAAAGPRGRFASRRFASRRVAIIAGVLAVAVAATAVIAFVLTRATPLTAKGNANAAVFTSAALKSFAHNWLNDANLCEVKGPDTTESEKVTCTAPRWSVNFRAYPDAAARDQGRQIRRTSFVVRSDQDLTGRGPRSGVRISYVQDAFHVVYWDDQGSPVSGDLFAYASVASLADLESIWDEYTG